MTDYRLTGIHLEQDTMRECFHALTLLSASPTVVARHPDGDVAAIRFTYLDRVGTDTIQIDEDANGARSFKRLSRQESGKELPISEPAHPLTEGFTLQDFLNEMVAGYRGKVRPHL